MKSLNTFLSTFIVIFIPILLSINSANAQVGFGLLAGGNLSRAEGEAFSSKKRIGYQAGIALSYSFTPQVALQLEPTYTAVKTRTNDDTRWISDGIAPGNQTLKYANVPLYLRLNFTKGIAVLAGPDINWLINQDDYMLNNNTPAFRDRTKFGITLGANLGALYFRYKMIRRNNNIVNNWGAQIEQFQLGLKMDII